MPVTGPPPDRATQRAEYEAYWIAKRDEAGLSSASTGGLNFPGGETPSEGDIAKITYEFGNQVVRNTIKNLQDAFNRISI